MDTITPPPSASIELSNQPESMATITSPSSSASIQPPSSLDLIHTPAQQESMATITPPPSSTSIQHFRFLDLSPELRNNIYELVLNLHRPVYLTSARDLRDTQRQRHIQNCPFNKHPSLPNSTGPNRYHDVATWCVNSFTNTQRKLSIPLSVLSLRQVCKKIDNEMRYTFFAINEFHFRHAAQAQTVFACMANLSLVSAIQVMGFHFYGRNAPKIYPHLAELCPDLRVLRVAMTYGDQRSTIKRPRQSLRKATGVKSFITYVLKLEKLERLEMVGRDLLDSSVDGVGKKVPVDINHPDAIGTWLRDQVEEKKRKRERIDRNKIEKERIRQDRIWKKAEMEKKMERKKIDGKKKRAAEENDVTKPQRKRTKTAKKAASEEK